jgi:UDP-GlcNAc3NAcA epimerase
VDIMTVVGARPQFVKAAAVARAFDRLEREDVRQVFVHTGQHYDALMSDTFFAELGLPEPDHQLGIGSAPHGAQTGAIMAALETIVLKSPPDMIIVYGDTNSTLAAALVGAKCHVPVAHVEAGLRSFDRHMPEEINRIVADHVSSLLLCPSQRAVDLLHAEGIVASVHMVGDVMFDVFKKEITHLQSNDRLSTKLGLETATFGVVTIHRAENTDDPMRFDAIVAALSKLADTGLPLVWPVHPRARDLVTARELPAGIHLLEPATYNEMLWLLRDAAVVLTDSGGLQKEALWSGRPCVTMRDSTEWTETVDSGWNVLVGADTDRIVEAALALRPTGSPPPIYGDGNAADAVVGILLKSVGARA